MGLLGWLKGDPDKGGSFFCGKSDKGGNVEKDHPDAKVHSCINEPDHRNLAGSPTKHRCNCGWEWKGGR